MKSFDEFILEESWKRKRRKDRDPFFGNSSIERSPFLSQRADRLRMAAEKSGNIDIKQMSDDALRKYDYKKQFRGAILRGQTPKSGFSTMLNSEVDEYNNNETAFSKNADVRRAFGKSISQEQKRFDYNRFQSITDRASGILMAMKEKPTEPSPPSAPRMAKIMRDRRERRKNNEPAKKETPFEKISKFLRSMKPRMMRAGLPASKSLTHLDGSTTKIY